MLVPIDSRATILNQVDPRILKKTVEYGGLKALVNNLKVAYT